MSQSATEYQVRKQMFEALYEDYQKSIERFQVKWVHDQESTRDLCQETFKQLWELLCKQTVVKQYAYYKNWLYLTARHRAIDYLRQNRPMVYLSQSDSEENSWLDELRTEGLENRIDWICTQYDLLQLPPQQREYLVKYALGHKQKEIAEEEDISESTVSAYMSLGRINLRNKKSFVVSADLEERRRVSREINREIYEILVEAITTFSASKDETSREYLLHSPPSELCAWRVGSGQEAVRSIKQEAENFKESDQTVRDWQHYLDRAFIKPWRRVLIDAENKRRGLLNDTAVLGECGQYLF